MKRHKLNILTRQDTGSNASRRLRKVNKIPAILYGKDIKPEPMAVNAAEFSKLLKEIAGRATTIELTRDQGQGATTLSFLQEIQRDPITDRYLHVDFQKVKEDDKMVANVAVHTVGESTGVKNENGVLEIASYHLRLRTLPKDLPGLIEVDVSDLKVGGSIHVNELKPISGVEFLDDPNQTVVLCVAPQEEAAVDAAVPAKK